jgi:hypothetical protein
MPYVYQYIGEGHYKRVVVDDVAPYVEDGWYLSIADHKKPVSEVDSISDEPPTREELETQASKLGVKYNSRTKDEVLLKRINEAMQ